MIAEWGRSVEFTLAATAFIPCSPNTRKRHKFSLNFCGSLATSTFETKKGLLLFQASNKVYGCFTLVTLGAFLALQADTTTLDAFVWQSLFKDAHLTAIRVHDCCVTSIIELAHLSFAIGQVLLIGVCPCSLSPVRRLSPLPVVPLFLVVVLLLSLWRE